MKSGRVGHEPLRSVAEKSTLDERRRMAFERYGLTTRPDDSGKPLQYVVDDAGNWTMNCFSCHGGSVYGVSTPGAPNNRFALQTMTEEIRATKFRLGKPLSRMDVGALVDSARNDSRNDQCGCLWPGPDESSGRAIELNQFCTRVVCASRHGRTALVAFSQTTLHLHRRICGERASWSDAVHADPGKRA